jgi:hypothetical protein
LTVTLERPLTHLTEALAVRGAGYDPVARTLRFAGIAPADIAPTLALIVAEGYSIQNVDFTRSSLQDVFLDLVGRAH